MTFFLRFFCLFFQKSPKLCDFCAVQNRPVFAKKMVPQIVPNTHLTHKNELYPVQTCVFRHLQGPCGKVPQTLKMAKNGHFLDISASPSKGTEFFELVQSNGHTRRRTCCSSASGKMTRGVWGLIDIFRANSVFFTQKSLFFGVEKNRLFDRSSSKTGDSKQTDMPRYNYASRAIHDGRAPSAPAHRTHATRALHFGHFFGGFAKKKSFWGFWPKLVGSAALQSF